MFVIFVDWSEIGIIFIFVIHSSCFRNTVLTHNCYFPAFITFTFDPYSKDGQWLHCTHSSQLWMCLKFVFRASGFYFLSWYIFPVHKCHNFGAYIPTMTIYCCTFSSSVFSLLFMKIFKPFVIWDGIQGVFYLPH